ncbi:hypothetical protein G155_00189 [Mycobacterium sp. VKM Ac-1817D]|nr:hypothetical protein G155_00189 [Mycobacterium sp. VKM Ac-1817D]
MNRIRKLSTMVVARRIRPWQNHLPKPVRRPGDAGVDQHHGTPQRARSADRRCRRMLANQRHSRDHRVGGG